MIRENRYRFYRQRYGPRVPRANTCAFSTGREAKARSCLSSAASDQAKDLRKKIPMGQINVTAPQAAVPEWHRSCLQPSVRHQAAQPRERIGAFHTHALSLNRCTSSNADEASSQVESLRLPLLLIHVRGGATGVL